MSETLKTIVIGTSLTEASDGVVRIGAAVARASGASPWLVHGYPTPVVSPELGMEMGWIELQAKALRETLLQQASRTGLTVLKEYRAGQLRALMGSPPREIVNLAQEVKADLIVIGAAETAGLRRLFLGSTADGVIRKAPCPVLVVRDEAAFPPTRVEIPVDLSAVSANAFHQGLEFLARIGVPLDQTEALFVLSPFEVGGSIHFDQRQIERFARDELRRFVTAHSPGVVPFMTRVRAGYPREEILSVLEERKADLVVLGTHGRSGFERLTLGSVAAEVMHQAGCNLLIIPPAARPWLEATVQREEEMKGADWGYVSDEEAVAEEARA